MNILVIGAGMYVLGRGKTGVGTILSSLAENSKTVKIEKVGIIAKDPDNRPIIVVYLDGKERRTAFKK